MLNLTHSTTSEMGGEVSSSSCKETGGKVKQEREEVDSVLNLSLSPQVRLARLGHLQQQMPEDLTALAMPQDLSTSNRGRGRGRLEMPMDLTMRMSQLAPADAGLLEAADGATPLSAPEELEPGSVKDTLLSCVDTSSSQLDIDVSGDDMDAPFQVDSSASLNLDRDGDFVDFSLADVDFDDLQDLPVDSATESAQQEPSSS
jgi:hypothetical protein